MLINFLMQNIPSFKHLSDLTTVSLSSRNRRVQMLATVIRVEYVLLIYKRESERKIDI